MSQPDPVIHAENLTRRFGDFVAVDQLSFEIFPGEVVGYLTFNKDANPLSITITKAVTVVVEWKCAKYYMTCELKEAGV